VAKSKKVTDKDGRIWDSADELTMYKWLIEAGYKEEDSFITQGKLIEGRRFRGDFVFPKDKVVLEVMGMDIWGQAGHNNVFTIANDYKRHLLMIQNGWCMLYWCKGVTKAEILACLDYVVH
jgi:very-short-patch-repair endonuclease